MEEPERVVALRRWRDAGAVWRILARGDGAVTVGMYTCSGGEEVERFSSTDPAVLRFVDAEDGGDE